MGALLGVLVVCGAVGWWAGTYERAQVATRTLRFEAPVSTDDREPWQRDPDDEPEPDEPDPLLGRLLPNPDAFFKSQRKKWDGIQGRPTEILAGCPVCRGTVLRRKEDGARYCEACNRVWQEDFNRFMRRLPQCIVDPPDPRQTPDDPPKAA